MLSKGASFVQDKHLSQPLDWLSAQGVVMLPPQEEQEPGK